MPANRPDPKPPPRNEDRWSGLREKLRGRERAPNERLEKPLRPKLPNPREPRKPKERKPPKRLASASWVTRTRPSEVRAGAPKCAGARNSKANNTAMSIDFMRNLRMRQGPERSLSTLPIIPIS